MDAWRAGSAYLYILQLDRSALAWEYLRRNPQYKKQWDAGELLGESSTAIWGCSIAEDPALDARHANPCWLPHLPEIVCLTHSTDPQAQQTFSLWALRGVRSMMHTGSHLLLRAEIKRRAVRLQLDDSVMDGEPFAYIVNADKLVRERVQAICEIADVRTRQHRAKSKPKRTHFSRRRLMHARTLQALDAKHAGASQRDTAIALFGEEEVLERWSPDSDLRAQVRYLLRRGTRLVNGGYRELLTREEG
jgi:hypothetical protein